MARIAVSQLVLDRLERLAFGRKFSQASLTLLADGRWEFEVDEEILQRLNAYHADPERALRIMLGLPCGRDN